MSEKRFIVESVLIDCLCKDEPRIAKVITDTDENYSYEDLYEVAELLNEQQSLIGQLQDENLYKNFKLNSVDDLKKLKDIFEICIILIGGAISNEDLELGYESVFQFERRIKKFNGD